MERLEFLLLGADLGDGGLAEIVDVEVCSAGPLSQRWGIAAGCTKVVVSVSRSTPSAATAAATARSEPTATAVDVSRLRFVELA